jgi:hypothetical protein
VAREGFRQQAAGHVEGMWMECGWNGPNQFLAAGPEIVFDVCALSSFHVEGVGPGSREGRWRIHVPSAFHAAKCCAKLAPSETPLTPQQSMGELLFNPSMFVCLLVRYSRR